MRLPSLLLSVAIATAAPFSYPLSNGFPNLNSTALQKVYALAGGTIPNGPLPTNISASGAQALQLIAANEIFEVAFFTDLLNNITSAVPGYTDVDAYTVETLTAVLAQEQLHALSANAVLQSTNNAPIQPCQYIFPVSTFTTAIALAQTFTDLVLSVLPQAQYLFSKSGPQEKFLIPIVGSIIGQEGEQNGFYRSLQKKVASSAPFLTQSEPQFAYSALLRFIVPGSCPNLNVLNLTAFPPLNIETTPESQNSTQLFSIPSNTTTVSANDTSIVYLSGINLPVSVPIQGVNTDTTDGKTYFFASFPFEGGFSRGLTVAALVGGANQTFNSSAQVAEKTLAGPALIEVE